MKEEIIINGFGVNILAILLSGCLISLPISYLQYTVSVWWVFVVFFGCFLHECLHYTYYKTKIGKVKMGVLWLCRVFPTPYNHPTEALRMVHYRTGLLVPTVILVPALLVVTLWFHSFFVYLVAMAMLIGGLGDILIWLKTKNVRRDAMVKDHPSKIGVVLE